VALHKSGSITETAPVHPCFGMSYQLPYNRMHYVSLQKSNDMSVMKHDANACLSSEHWARFEDANKLQ
jgi:hypothetical protein